MDMCCHFAGQIHVRSRTVVSGCKNQIQKIRHDLFGIRRTGETIGMENRWAGPFKAFRFQCDMNKCIRRQC
eukprot:502570-Prorocentrum_lima.AAC.1